MSIAAAASNQGDRAITLPNDRNVAESLRPRLGLPGTCNLPSMWYYVATNVNAFLKLVRISATYLLFMM